MVGHITYYELPRCRRAVRDLLDPQDLRVDYILGKKTKKELGMQIYRRDIRRKKNTELLHLYELISVVGIEYFNILINNLNSGTRNNYLDIINTKLQEVDNLRIYCNNEFAKISITYNHKTTHINDAWVITSKKYKISDTK